MYQITLTEEVYRNNPWDIPYKDRVAKLRNAMELGMKTVVYLYPEFDSSTFRYRGYNVAETLEYGFSWRGACFQYSERNKLYCEDVHIDVLIIIRCPWDSKMEDFLHKMRKHGAVIGYDVDDLIYSPKYMPNIIEALGLQEDPELNFWYGMTQRYYMAAQMCDAYITTNDFLAGFLKNDFDKPCYTLKNYLNWLQERVSDFYYEEKQAKDSEKPFEIGYFSGSPTHVKDISIIMPEVEEFLNAHTDVVFKIVGYMNLPEKYSYLVDKKKIQFISFQTFTGLQYEQAKVDINVVPLVNNSFSNCKSELKYFESAIVGTVTCATPSHAYAKAIKNQYNGFLCKEGEWLEIFEKIYRDGHNKSLLRRIREVALKEYSGRNQLKDVERILESLYN